MTSLVRPSARSLAWLPAAFLLTAALVAAAGFGGVGSSQAASSGTTTVTATVAKEVHVNLNTGGACGTGTASATTITGTSLTTAQGDVSLASCRLTFGSNNSSSGANLLIESTRTSGTNHFCTTAPTGACVAPEFTEAAAAGVTPAAFGTGEAAAAGNFGIKANINSATCTGGWGASANYFGLSANTDATPNGATVCSTASTTDGDVTIDFRVNPGSSQPASAAYQVQTTLTATAI